MGVVLAAGLALLDRVDIHLPGVVRQRHPSGRGDVLGLVHHGAHQTTQVFQPRLLGKGLDMGQIRQRAYAVDRRVEDQFGPLVGQQVLIGLRLQARLIDQGRDLRHILIDSAALGPGAHPGGGVQLVLHMGVGVANAAHKGDAGYDGPGAETPDHLLATQAVLNHQHLGLGEMTLHRFGARFDGQRLGGDNHQIHLAQGRRIRRSKHSGAQLGLAAHPQTLLVQGPGMVLAARQHDGVHYRAKMTGQQTADNAGPDDANPVDRFHGFPTPLSLMSLPW